MSSIDLPSSRPWSGGSSVAAILCLPNPGNRTPLTEYLRLTSEDSPLDMEDEQFFEGRKSLELYMAHKLRTRGVMCNTFNERYTHPKYPFMRAEIDAETAESNEEFKTSTEFLNREFGVEGSDDFPMYMAAQLQWGLGIHPKPQGFLNVCLGFDRFKRYPIEPDPALFQQMEQRVLEFWERHVIPRVPPAPVTLEDAKLLWPRSMGRSILASDELIGRLQYMGQLDARIKELTEEKDMLRLDCEKELGDADQALKPDGKPAVTYRSNKDSLVLDKDELINRLEAKLLEHGPSYIGWITEQRKALTKLKPGARPFINKLK